MNFIVVFLGLILCFYWAEGQESCDQQIAQYLNSMGEVQQTEIPTIKRTNMTHEDVVSCFTSAGCNDPSRIMKQGYKKKFRLLKKILKKEERKAQKEKDKKNRKNKRQKDKEQKEGREKKNRNQHKNKKNSQMLPALEKAIKCGKRSFWKLVEVTNITECMQEQFHDWRPADFGNKNGESNDDDDDDGGGNGDDNNGRPHHTKRSRGQQKWNIKTETKKLRNKLPRLGRYMLRTAQAVYDPDICPNNTSAPENASQCLIDVSNGSISQELAGNYMALLFQMYDNCKNREQHRENVSSECMAVLRNQTSYIAKCKFNVLKSKPFRGAVSRGNSLCIRQAGLRRKKKERRDFLKTMLDYRRNYSKKLKKEKGGKAKKKPPPKFDICDMVFGKE